MKNHPIGMLFFKEGSSLNISKRQTLREGFFFSINVIPTSEKGFTASDSE